jgi:alanyl-tRNA synthetase
MTKQVVTQRLYFDDPYQTHFVAHVVDQHLHGDGFVVALDQSAFYPEGGGQPADHGTLNDIIVSDVQVDEHGVVWHSVTQPISTTQVNGQINWTRRFDHMQQHLGQHLLSAAFEQLFGWKTVSFHLGAESATIDLDTPQITTDQSNATSELVNQVIWENRPVQARFVTPVELATLTLRKPPSVSGAIRVVSVPDFDHSACGGTHPTATGSVGLIAVRRTERRGETTRVEFLCGKRASADYQQRAAIVNRMASQLSLSITDLEGALARLQNTNAAQHKQIEALTKQVLQFEAQTLFDHAAQTNHGRVVSMAFHERAIDEVRSLAQAITAVGGTALFGISGTKPQLVFASANHIDCNALLRATVAAFGGRGGGQPSLAQGGIPDPHQLEMALAYALQHIQT